MILYLYPEFYIYEYTNNVIPPRPTHQTRDSPSFVLLLLSLFLFLFLHLHSHIHIHIHIKNGKRGGNKRHKHKHTRSLTKHIKANRINKRESELFNSDDSSIHIIIVVYMYIYIAIAICFPIYPTHSHLTRDFLVRIWLLCRCVLRKVSVFA